MEWPDSLTREETVFWTLNVQRQLLALAYEKTRYLEVLDAPLLDAVQELAELRESVNEAFMN